MAIGIAAEEVEVVVVEFSEAAVSAEAEPAAAGKSVDPKRKEEKMVLKRTMKPSDFLTEEEMQWVKQAVTEAEKTTSGEIRVVIRSDLEKGVDTPREQAIHEFYRLGIQNTRDKTGVLIMLVLNKRKIEVIGDSGINEKVAPQTWDNIVFVMSNGIRMGKRCEAICNTVAEIGKILSNHFPRKSDDINELPNDVVVEEK